MVTRLLDWEARLGAYLSTPGRDQFEWGANDCALFSCGAVEAMTGDHPFPEFLGVYTDREGAARALRDLGEGTLYRTFGSRFPNCENAFAQRGDIVWAQGALGICLGPFALFLSDDGFERVPRAQFEDAWRIG